LPTGSQLHGLFFSLLGRIDPDLAAAVHGAPERPFTLSPLLDDQGKPQEPELRSRRRRHNFGPSRPSGPSTVYWRLTLLDDRHAAALVRGASRATQQLDRLNVGPVA